MQDLLVSVRRSAHSSSAGLFDPRRSLWGQVCITVPIKHVPTGIKRLTASAPYRSSEAMFGRRSAMGFASFRHGWASAACGGCKASGNARVFGSGRCQRALGNFHEADPLSAEGFAASGAATRQGVAR